MKRGLILVFAGLLTGWNAAAFAVPSLAVVNREALLARYLPETPAERARFESQLQPVLDRLLSSNGIDLLLDAKAVVAGGERVDLTPQVIAAMDMIRMPVSDISGVTVQSFDRDIVFDPHALVVDRASFERAFPGLSPADLDARIEPLLSGYMHARQANLVLDRKAVLLGTIDVDITSRIAGGLASEPQADPAPRASVVVLNRAVVLADSRSGKSIADQVRKLTRAAEAEFKSRPDMLRQRKQEIENGQFIARREMEAALEPVLQEILTLRAANLLIDRQAVVFGHVDADITQQAISGLDRVLPAVTVAPSKTRPD